MAAHGVTILSNSSSDPITALKLVRDKFSGTSNWNNPLAWRQATLEAGMPRLDLPLRVGGKNWMARQMIDVFAACGKISLDLRDVPGGGHSRLLLGARERKHDAILRMVGEAKEFVALAITEEGAGSDLHAIKTVAQPISGGYLVYGRKLYVSRLLNAQRVVLFANVRRYNYGEAMLTAFILPFDLPGIQVEQLESLGLKGVSFGGLYLDNVFVPYCMRIGGEGEGFRLFVHHFTYWRLAMAAAAVGCARGAIEQATSWLYQREAFGGSIGRFTHLQPELAEHVARLHMAWLLVVSVAERIDAHLPTLTDASMAKAEAVEIALSAADWAMRIHGARGYTNQLDLERRVRDLMGLRIADGTTDVLRGQVARALLGNGLYEMSLGREDKKVGDSLSTRRFW